MTARETLGLRLLLLWVLLELAAAAQVRTASGHLLVTTWLTAASQPIDWICDELAAAGRAVVASMASRQRVARDHRRLERDLEFELARRVLLQGELDALREMLSTAPGVVGFGDRPVVARCLYRNLAVGRLEVRTPESVTVAADTPAIGSGGLMGRVISGGGHTAWIELIIHPAAAVAVQTEDGLIQAIAAGTGGHELEIHYVPRSAPLVVDAVLITSGADGVYPVGIPVATVTHVREREAAFLEVRARPTAAIATARVVFLLPLVPAAGPRGSRP